MHDIKAIRENPAAFDAAWARKGLEPQTPRILELDVAVRAAQTQRQEAEAGRNAASKAIGAAKAKKDEAEAQRLMAEVARLKEVIEAGAAAEDKAAGELRGILEGLPNTPALDVPDGADEHGNVEQRRWWKGQGAGPPGVDLSADHVTLGEGLGLMDFEAAARMSGSRFVALKGELARLERALAAFMLDLQTSEHGYQEVSPPYLVLPKAAFGTNQLPKFAEDLFGTKLSPREEAAAELSRRLNQLDAQIERFRSRRTPNEDIAAALLRMRDDTTLESVLSEYEDNPLVPSHYLIPTAEVSLTNLVRETILDESQLATPIRMTADTPCFRSEAGSAGRDTRGMIRMHQFRKVELVSITRPEDSREEHERMVNCAEEVLKRLELPFRTILLCAGDMGFGAKKTYDLEVWLPSQATYREISSCSNCGDFQARRMDARFRREGQKGTEFVHTLNGSGLAVGRTLVAVMENYQEPDGSIAIPAVLQPYMGGVKKISKA